MLDLTGAIGATIIGQGWDDEYDLPFLRISRPAREPAFYTDDGDSEWVGRLYVKRDEEGNGPGDVDVTGAGGYD